MELPEVVILIVSTVAVPVLAQVFKMIAAKYGVELGRKWITVIVTAVSCVIAYFVVRTSVVMPADPMQALAMMIEYASAIVGVATAVYNLILEKLFALVGLAPASKVVNEKADEQRQMGEGSGE